MGNQNFKPNVKVQFIKGAAVNMYTFSFYVAMKKYTSLRRHPLLLEFLQSLSIPTIEFIKILTNDYNES